MTSLSDFSGRLITLNDGRAGIRGGMHVEIREPSDSQPSTLNSQPVLDFIASDESLDRYNETISAAGWKLGNYQRNPVFQNAHQHGDIIHTLGRALTTEVRSGTLRQRVQFACDINPIARIAYGLYRGKFLNAVSVGFVPIRWENGTEKTAYTRKFVEQELLEVSAVAIPANPNALTLGLKSGAIEKSDLRDCYDLFRLTLESSPSSSNPPDQPSTLNSQLIQLALEFHRLLKS
jgi:HK97 family phage prohead protease